MAIRQGGFKRRSKVSGDIPDSSMADIAFLLLIFFMVTTVFRSEDPREVVVPEAEATETVDERRQNIVHLWIEPDGAIFINDRRIPPGDVADVLNPLYIDTDRRLVVAIRADRDVPYSVIDDVSQEIREAATATGGVARVNFATDVEQRLTRARR